VKMQGTLSNVSLVVITFNEQGNIRRCIDSARGVGEVIVVDSFSTDRTVDIAREMGAEVFQRPYLSAAEQKNWAMQKAGKEWILVLDADEALSTGLWGEIEDALVEPTCDGFWLRRKNVFLGRRIRFCGWQRDRVLRLFRRGKGRYPPQAVHERLVLDGRSRRLRGYLDHVPYNGIEDYIDRMKSYSGRSAADLRARGKGWFPALVTHPLGRFLRMYLLQLGFLDGTAGLELCCMASAGVFFKYARLRELYRTEKGTTDDEYSP
jgi:glycosyltransferase involved in cell wall biosynthesis